MRHFHWGIIGLGKIARKFAESLALLPNARLHAVGSRSAAKAQEFAARFGAAHAFGSYEELLTLPDLDVVYVATPHSEHCAHTLLCLRAGVPVLCEKPFALNAKQVQEMIATARERQLFLMEGLWTRFFPAIHRALEMLRSGAVGEVQHVAADFGFRANYDPNGRLFNPALAGGSLLDIGIYPLLISKLVLGQPTQVKAAAALAQTGVDLNCAVALAYASGATASLFSTLAAHTDTACTVYGTQGKLHLHSRFHETHQLTLHLTGQDPQLISCEKIGTGFHYQAQHVQECLAAGHLESPLLPWTFSLELTQLMDEIRGQIGVRYPGE